MDVLILGCGYTGERVARRFLARGARVIAASRDPGRLAGLGVEAVRFDDLPGRLNPGTFVLHSIPPAGEPDLLRLLGDRAARLVYLSSTAVYGTATVVNDNTPVDPSSERIQAERHAAAGPWSTLILRPAAIYGPGRGVHQRLARGEYQAGDNFVSRIHVDDLAAHVEAGLLSTLTGAYPVADEEPCTAREIGTFCAQLLDLPLPDKGGRPTANRRVDGSAIRGALGITLAYPSYRTGIPAAIQVERGF
jgi:nucleoside-diphosphate-sugar epimerase